MRLRFQQTKNEGRCIQLQFNSKKIKYSFRIYGRKQKLNLKRMIGIQRWVHTCFIHVIYINTPGCIRLCRAANLAETVYKSDHKSKSQQSNREQRKK